VAYPSSAALSDLHIYRLLLRPLSHLFVADVVRTAYLEDHSQTAVDEYLDFFVVFTMVLHVSALYSSIDFTFELNSLILVFVDRYLDVHISVSCRKAALPCPY
jgi:succinate-acetate transporter protein